MAIYIVYIGALLYIIILLCHSSEEIKCNPLGWGGGICYPSYTHFAGNGATVELIGAPGDAGERRALS